MPIISRQSEVNFDIIYGFPFFMNECKYLIKIKDHCKNILSTNRVMTFGRLIAAEESIGQRKVISLKITLCTVHFTYT